MAAQRSGAFAERAVTLAPARDEAQYAGVAPLPKARRRAGQEEEA
jgi:hypothetical protein